MSSTSDTPAYDLQTSFYGPGALSTWYLALLCMLITWLFHPTKRFPRLSLSADVVFYALYACLAAGHMAVLIQHFEPDEILELEKYFRSSYSNEAPQEKVLERFSPSLQKMVAGINAPFRIGVLFLWAAGFSLIAVFCVKDVTVRPRRRRMLPWVLFVSEAWVIGCFCFLATRCGMTTVLSTVCVYSGLYLWNFFQVLILGSVNLSAFQLTTSLFLQYGKDALNWVSELGVSCQDVRRLFLQLPLLASYLTSARKLLSLAVVFVELLVYACLIGLLLSGLGLLFLGCGVMLGALSWYLPQWLWTKVCNGWPGFPHLGVSMSAFDQILGLCTGFIAVLFTIHTACGEKLDWAARVRSAWQPEAQAASGLKYRLMRLVFGSRPNVSAVGQPSYELDNVENGLGAVIETDVLGDDMADGASVERGSGHPARAQTA